MNGSYQLIRCLLRLRQYFQCFLFECYDSRFDIFGAYFRLFIKLDAGDKKWVARQKLLYPKALHTLTNDMMGVIRSRQVAQNFRHSANRMEIIGFRFFILITQLHDQADRFLGTNGLLNRCNRAYATYYQGRDVLWKKYGTAHGYNNQCIIRNSWGW